MPVLLFQAFIIFTIVIARFVSPKLMAPVATLWSVFSLIMIFMPWLMIVQLGVVWGAYFWLRPKKAKTQITTDPKHLTTQKDLK